MALLPHLTVAGAVDAIEFYRQVFGAREIGREAEPLTGRLLHAELKIGRVRLLLNDEFPEHRVMGPLARGGTSVVLHLEVDDPDAVAARAAELGGAVLVPVADQHWGERYGRIRDPFGHVWDLSCALNPSPEQASRDGAARRPARKARK